MANTGWFVFKCSPPTCRVHLRGNKDKVMKENTKVCRHSVNKS